MKTKIYSILIVVTFGLQDCSKTSAPANKPFKDSIYYQTNFDKVSLSPQSGYIDFVPAAMGIPSFLATECYMGFGGAYPTYANGEIVTDNSRKVLKGSLYGDDPNVGGLTRFQTDILTNVQNYSSTQTKHDLTLYHISHRMFLNSDFSYLSQYPLAINEFGAPDWTILYEVWNQFNPTWDGEAGGSARWDLSLAKDAGANASLYWLLSGEKMQPAANEYDPLWTPLTNKTIPVPIAQWFTLDFYMQRGEGTAGKLEVSIQLDGGTKQILFTANNTTIYPGHPELLLYKLSPFKIYMSQPIMQFMSNAGKNMNILYNDFQWHYN